MHKATAFIKQSVSYIAYWVEKFTARTIIWHGFNNYRFRGVFQTIKIPVLITDGKSIKQID
jgi:hypothetical protein